MIGTRKLQEKNRIFFLELAHFLRKSSFVLFIDRSAEGLLTELSIISRGREIGTLQTTLKNSNLFRQNTGNVLVVASSIPDNLSGELFHKSILGIGNSLKVCFELVNPNLFEEKRVATMKIIE